MRKLFIFLLSFFLIAVFAPQAPAWRLPDTGQTQSYTETFGEDSDYTINPPSYTDNGYTKYHAGVTNNGQENQNVRATLTLPLLSDGDGVAEADIKEMIEKFGPILWLRNDEKYLLDDPEHVLDNGVKLAWGAIKNGGYDSFQIFFPDSKLTSSETLMDDVDHAKGKLRSLPSNESERKLYWLRIPGDSKFGDLSRAVALIHVLRVDQDLTEIQFWFFYPFNGPGRVEVCASGHGPCDDNWLEEVGRHYGDWERVSLLVSNDPKRLLAVDMSRHGDSKRFFRAFDNEFRSEGNRDRILELEDDHPVIYSAISSHAHYHSAGNHYYKRVFSFDWGLGKASADLFDRSEKGKRFNTYEPDNYRIISSDYFAVRGPEWLDFDGRWGQYERLSDVIKWGQIPPYTYLDVGRGPKGPKQQEEWEGVWEPIKPIPLKTGDYIALQTNENHYVSRYGDNDILASNEILNQHRVFKVTVFEESNEIALQASNCRYFSRAGEEDIKAHQQSVNRHCVFKVAVFGGGDYIALQASNGKYVNRFRSDEIKCQKTEIDIHCWFKMTFPKERWEKECPAS